MATSALGLDGDVIVKILTVGFSGLAFLLSLMAFLMFRDTPATNSAKALEAYRLKINAMTRYLVFTFALMLMALAFQYAMEQRESKIRVTVQESGMFSELELKPIKVKRRDYVISIPGEKDASDRGVVAVKDEDQLDLSLVSLTQVIGNQKLLIGKLTSEVGKFNKETGYDEHH